MKTDGKQKDSSITNTELETIPSNVVAEVTILGDATVLTGAMPNARWQDGSFNPTRYKA